ncbi:MAG: type II toxin-antitoxin system VapC family toxin [Nitrospira sp.]|nr:type II toxin-antitoxin system VapC family toxin [Nitrospira sp.]
MDNSYVLDSYALITHFEDEPGGERVRNILKAARDGKTKLYLSVINFGEVYYNTMRERGIEKANETKLIVEQLPIIVIDAEKSLTMEAARLKALYPVAYADCFAAALGVMKKSKVVTGDPEFKKLSKTVKVEWIG